MSDVICLGELLIDFCAAERNRSLTQVSSFHAAPGGAPANVAVALQRLGELRAGFCGKVGKDPFGDKLCGVLKQDGVDTTFLFRDDSRRTTINFVANWDDGHKELCFYRDADRYLESMNIQFSLLKDATCLHFGSITMISDPGASAQQKALQMARDLKTIMITYDPNYRPTLWTDEDTATRIILDGYRYAHLAKISEEEWMVATGGHEDFKSGIQTVLDCGVELLIVSRGDRGAMATNGKFTVESDALNNIDIQVIETTGAGDGFMAAIITRLLPEFKRLGNTLKSIAPETVKEALDFANVVGGLTCSKAGAIPSLPTMKQVRDFQSTRNEPSIKVVRITTTLRPSDLAGMIDHTFLKPYGRIQDIEKLCQEARQFGFAMVAIHPSQVRRCVKLLEDSNVQVGACVGFPLGQNTTAVKAFETRDAIENGATEIDMVLNVFELQNSNYEYVQRDIEAVVGVCKESEKRILCKVILEVCYLTKEQTVKACAICREAGADFVKTSTGFGPSGASVEDVQLMRHAVGEVMGVKASGGIRDLKTAKGMIAAGANRIGTSRGVAIMQEALQDSSVAS